MDGVILKKEVTGNERYGTVEIVTPLETTRYNKEKYEFEAVPTDQGEMLLDFLRRHLFTKPREE